VHARSCSHSSTIVSLTAVPLRCHPRVVKDIGESDRLLCARLHHSGLNAPLPVCVGLLASESQVGLDALASHDATVQLLCLPGLGSRPSYDRARTVRCAENARELRALVGVRASAGSIAFGVTVAPEQSEPLSQGPVQREQQG
jgi:hypothetical protein